MRVLSVLEIRNCGGMYYLCISIVLSFMLWLIQVRNTRQCVPHAINALNCVIPPFVRLFSPLLLRTILKSMRDTTSVVIRTEAAQALGELMKYQPRIRADPMALDSSLSDGLRRTSAGGLRRVQLSWHRMHFRNVSMTA